MIERIIKSMVEVIFSVDKVGEMITNINVIMEDPNINNFINIVSRGVLLIGILLTTMFLAKRTVLLFETGNNTPLSLFSPFIYYAVAIILIGSYTSIVDFLIEFGNVFNNFMASVSINTETANTMAEDVIALIATETDNFKLLPSMSIMVVLLIPAAIAFLLNLYIGFILYSRQISIFLRMMFFPIALSFAADNNQTSTYNYVKKFLALIMQLGVITAILTLMGFINSAILGMGGELSIVSIILTQLTLSVVFAGMIGKSLSFTEELLGVG